MKVGVKRHLALALASSLQGPFWPSVDVNLPFKCIDYDQWDNDADDYAREDCQCGGCVPFEL